ncbi:MAG: TVP38/TMEM64 family protein [Clostridia bacterium]|nr:TVP38/TMEM64 family protein [Clostridia bacterium]
MANDHNRKKFVQRFRGEKERTEEEKKILLKRKRAIAIISFIIAAGLFLWFGYAIAETLTISIESGQGISDAAGNFKNLISGYGEMGVVVAFGIQVLQVVVSPIPGEVIEVGMGLCFGWFEGALVCLLGSALATAIIMIFVKKLGFRFVELFIPLERINELRFINSEKKLERFAFLLYLIPGTPKDPLIFFFGLTKINIVDFVVISTIARIPSVVSSTIGGKFLVDKNYLGAILIFAITGIAAIVGIFLYKTLLEKLRTRKKNKHSHENEENI